MGNIEAYQYAIWRVIPDLQRGEFLNAGVILYCKRLRFLESRSHLDRDRFLSFRPGADYETVLAHLQIRDRIARGDPSAGELAKMNDSQRFGWLVSPASTIIQPSEVHTGLCDNPLNELDRLFRNLVL